MTPKDSLVSRFEKLRAWSRGDQRAVHKPLLALYSIGQAGRGAARLMPFNDIDQDLRALLIEFGPPRRSVHTEYPFWRLQNDGIWEVLSTQPLKGRESNSDPLKSELLAKNVHGGFTAEVYLLLKRSKTLRERIIATLLDAHFPETLHVNVREAVGLTGSLSAYETENRSPAFRKEVLRVYGYSCCVCGYDLRLGSQFIGIEAAHIKWFQAGGPDETNNGLALCTLHHKLFDLGAFTVEPSTTIIICSQDLSQSARSDWMLNFHRTPIRPPQHSEYAPKTEFLRWHGTQVFRAPGRH